MTGGISGDTMRDLLLHHIVPGLGCLVAFTMFISPLSAVLRVRKLKRLGELNPLPFVAIIANCTGWLIYGCIHRDPYVIAANVPGLMLGFFMTLSCYGFANSQVRDLILWSLLGFSLLITSTSIYIAMALDSLADQVTVSGYLAVAILLVYYAAPLSVLAKVLVTRNSTSLYWPLAFMSCVNGSLWVAYGWAIGDMFVWGPNAVGAILGIVQILLILIFPANKGGENEDPFMTGGEAEDPLISPNEA